MGCDAGFFEKYLSARQEMANCCLAALYPLFGALAGSRIEKRPAAANVAQGRLSLTLSPMPQYVTLVD